MLRRKDPGAPRKSPPLGNQLFNFAQKLCSLGLREFEVYGFVIVAFREFVV